MGRQYPDCLGTCDRQFRLVDRHRPRRHFDIGDLLLLKQDWRTSINRFAEAMTFFAVACAGMFPILHLGRPWLFYWLLPYPNTMQLWPQPRSPLIWDVFAVSTYAHSLSAVLVRGSDSGRSFAARPGDDIAPEIRLRNDGIGLAGINASLGSL